MVSKTEDNLKKAFAGESMARNKYTFFANVAIKEGYHYIARIFLETADNEFEHGEQEFKLLKGIGDTKANLKAAIEGEHYETSQMYPDFQVDAEKEGNKAAATLFKETGEVESHHEKRYKKLLEMLENGTLYKRSKPIAWKCSKCGYIHVGKEPPEKCPLCHHAKEYYAPECMCFEDNCELCK